MLNTTFMKRALRLAERGKGRTSPNPMVGAVLAENGRIISEGFHRHYGSIHAEADAIDKAEKSGCNLENAELYVTLEPCCHSGPDKINPPCTDRIIQSGIKKVIIASRDPNPRVWGRGIRILEKNGIRVIEGILADQEQELNRAYRHRMLNMLPYVHLKLAASLDSFISDFSGRSKWITGEKARMLVHKWRAESDGIMTGIGTVLKDNPSLTARINGKELKNQPARIILDTNLQIPYECSLASDRFLSNTHIFYNPGTSDVKKAEKLADRGVNLHQSDIESAGSLDLTDVLKKLADMKIFSILAEGGSSLAGSLLRNKLVNRFSLFTAPVILGTGMPLFSGMEGLTVDSPIRISNLKIKKAGEDFLFSGTPVYEKISPGEI